MKEYCQNKAHCGQLRVNETGNIWIKEKKQGQCHWCLEEATETKRCYSWLKVI